MIPAGLRLRRMREKLGMTYRDVEQASYGIAASRGRPDFIVHISRLADIENRNVVPSLHKLYSLATIYHASPTEITEWYEAPFHQSQEDGVGIPTPRTHLHEVPSAESEGVLQPGVPPSGETGLICGGPQLLAISKGPMKGAINRFRYGNIGLSDRRMVPILRPGSIVVVDTALRKIEDLEWTHEYDRPLYFVETREGYRCGWFHRQKSRLIMQPHPLSRCAPEAWRTPDDAEIVGKVVGVTTYLNEPWASPLAASRPTRSDWTGTGL